MRIWLSSLLILLLGMLASPGAAQDSVVTKQERARLLFQELSARMQRLQAALAGAEPEESRSLAAGNRFIQEARLPQRLDEVRGLLTAERWDESLAKMKEIQGDLKRLMDLLLRRDRDVEKLLEQIHKLSEFQKRVEQLIAEQQAEKENASRTEALEQHLLDLEQARQAIEDLIAGQKRLREQAGSEAAAANPKTAEEMGQKQGGLKENAEKVAQQLEKLEKEAAGLLPKDPGQSKPGPGQPGEGKAGGSCSGSCQSASGAMGQAQQKLAQNQAQRSVEDMDQALQHLENARKELEKKAEAAKRELLALPFDQQIRAQEVTKVSTDKLAEEMESVEEKPGEKSKAPGADNVRQAVPKQKAAAGSLKERKAGKAKQEQQDAKEQLEQAKKALEDALAQLRQQLQDEVLRAMEERLAAMLEKQKELSASTRAIEGLRQGALAKVDTLPDALRKRCLEVGEGEGGLAGEAVSAIALLEQEGTTAVFPDMLGEVRDLLNMVAERTRALETGAFVQERQKEIETTLAMLLDALRRAIEDGEAGQCSQCNGQPQLVPISAELKLILGLQKQVAKKTTEYDGRVGEARATPQGQQEAQLLSKRQGRVEELTRKLATKLAKDEAGGEEGK